MSDIHGRSRRLMVSGAVVAAFAVASSLPLPAGAGDLDLSSAEAVDVSELQEQRAGDFTITDGNGEFLVAQSRQTVENNKINSPFTAETANGGPINIGDEALGNARGMINVTANSGPGSLVNSVMSLTVVTRE